MGQTCAQAKKRNKGSTTRNINAAIIVGKNKFEANATLRSGETLDGWYTRTENNGWRPIPGPSQRRLSISHFEPYEKEYAKQHFQVDELSKTRKKESVADIKRRRWEEKKILYYKGWSEELENKALCGGNDALSYQSETETYNANDEDPLLNWLHDLDYDEYMRYATEFFITFWLQFL